ncbi:MAG: sigma-54-dependent Fis family transcriptional regulator [Micromonosporaceae bacterium]
MPATPPAGDAPARPEIAASWHRARRAGLAPQDRIDGLPVADVDRTSRLMVAAKPVLDEMTVQLVDTTLCLALADRDCQIIDVRFTDRRVEQVLEQVGAVPGRRVPEEVSGTNSLATTYETGSGLLVNGAEHFLESLRQFSCYGHPIRHPVTRRLEGVLDITGVMPTANPLFVPFVRWAVRDVEQRLLEGSRQSEQHLLAAFRAAAQHRHRAVVVLDPDVVLTNPAAVDLLELPDHAMLRTVAYDTPLDRSLRRQLTLASGQVVDAEVSRIDGTGGVLFQLAPAERRRADRGGNGRRTAVPGSAVADQLARLRDGRYPVLISGEPGSGRTTAVSVLAGDGPLVTLDAARIDDAGWTRLEELAATHPGVLAIEELQLLPPAVCVRLARLLADSTARIVLTGVPRSDLGSDAARLAAGCPATVELPPLRSRRDELPALAHGMLAEQGADPSVRFAPSTLAALAGHHWPGNLRELRMVVRHAAQTRSAGDITVADLPEAYRGLPPSRALTRWEQAERDAIVSALRATGGNKRHAAEQLGISRSTLYNRIRVLRISV